MNISAFVSAPRSGISFTKKRKRIKTYSLKMLRQYVPQELPLLVHVSSTSIETDFVMYNCTLSSLSTKNTWSVAYRYSEFADFRAKLEELWTCHDPKCSGSCQAVREYVSACFPKKRLALMSTNSRTISSRKSKFESMLMHLLRCVLLPGSAMRCFQARQNLPMNLFKFLRVEKDVDRRSLLQIFIDNYQIALKEGSGASLTDSFYSRASTVDSASESTQCMICLCDVDLEHDHQQCDSECVDTDNSAIVLPCKHVFHRECVFEWLLFEFHCPMCRARVCSDAVTNYCRPKDHVQWWLGDFEEDPFHPTAA
ncbi:RING finger ubiquitin ligase [Phytophthora megakarya]|uniref:RING finger ubiquitin ligase n=1 Tax=Phytophthora megakarya TaxID=4795 RepID=A0A225WZ02_9STRA|nr:RING finger ubiquitin ligase [Phytophthora megakarya]